MKERYFDGEKSSTNNLCVIGIAGGSASGKSTFSNKLVDTLASYRVKEFHMDDYFKLAEQRPFSEAPVTQKFYVDDNHPIRWIWSN